MRAAAVTFIRLSSNGNPAKRGLSVAGQVFAFVEILTRLTVLAGPFSVNCHLGEGTKVQALVAFGEPGGIRAVSHAATIATR